MRRNDDNRPLPSSRCRSHYSSFGQYGKDHRQATHSPEVSPLRYMRSTSVRIDRETHQELKRLAAEIGATVGETVALAVRRLGQDRIGDELRAPLSDGEVGWLDAGLG